MRNMIKQEKEENKKYETLAKSGKVRNIPLKH